MAIEDAGIVWALRAPLEDDVFAGIAWHGTWTSGKTCKVCGKSASERVGPLVVEWQTGSEVVGDFTWLGYGMEVIIQDRVRRALEEKYRFRGFECHPIEMVEAPWRQRAKSRAIKATRRVKCVELPYRGPALWEMRTTKLIAIDRTRSRFRYKQCSACGNEEFEFVRQADPISTVIDAADVEGADIFRIREASVFIACKDVVKRAIEAERFANVRFTQWGVILPDVRDSTWSPPSVVPSSTSPTREHEKPPSAPLSEPGLLKLSDGRIIRFEDLPDDIDVLQSWRIEFPELPKDERLRHPEFMDRLLDYLRMESGYGDLTGHDLTFLRSARVGDYRYWLWSFEGTSGPNYATVREGPTKGGIGHNDGFRLTPEQFLLADYFEML